MAKDTVAIECSDFAARHTRSNHEEANAGRERDETTMATMTVSSDGELFVARRFADGFTSGIEGPACDRDGNVYAVDFGHSGTIGRVSPSGEASMWLRLPEGSHGCGMIFDGRGRLCVADWTGHNVLTVETETREVCVHAHHPDMDQPNDLAIAADGTIFASDPNWEDSTGRVWRVAPDGQVALLESGMGTTNGIEVSPDGDKLYVDETVQRTIWVYDLSPGGTISNKRLLARFPDFGLDGMRSDARGNLYVARYGKGVVAVLSPEGDLVREIPLESGRECTNLTFGGPEGRTVYVTVADDGHLERFEADTPGRSRVLWS